ncbi:MAG: efflux RND transporter periplasmic adaptor subunit [Sarcina sp.]
MKRKKVISIIIATIVIIGVGTFKFMNKNKSNISENIEKSTIAVEIYNTKNSQIEKYKKFSGVISAGEKEVVSPKALANITSIKVKKGDYIKKGQVLMTLDSSKLEEQITELDKVNNQIQGVTTQSKEKLDALRGKVIEISAKIENLETQVKILEADNIKIDTDLNNLQKKLEVEEITQEEYDTQKKLLDSSKNNNIGEINKNKIEIKTLEMTKKTLDKSISDLEKVLNASGGNNEMSGMLEALKDKKGDYTVVSTISGVVKEINLKVGQIPVSLVKPGMLIESTSNVDFEFKIMKEDLEKFKVGMDVITCVDINGKEEERKATIESISQEEDEKSKQYKVIATMQNSNEEIKIGDFVRLMLKTNVKKDVIVVPKDAVIREDGKSFVYISNNNIAKRVEIVTGIENHNEVEIQSGLNIGDKVIVKGKEFLEQGEKINIVKEVRLSEDN